MATYKHNRGASIIVAILIIVYTAPIVWSEEAFKTVSQDDLQRAIAKQNPQESSSVVIIKQDPIPVPAATKQSQDTFKTPQPASIPLLILPNGQAVIPTASVLEKMASPQKRPATSISPQKKSNPERHLSKTNRPHLMFNIAIECMAIGLTIIILGIHYYITTGKKVYPIYSYAPAYPVFQKSHSQLSRTTGRNLTQTQKTTFKRV